MAQLLLIEPDDQLADDYTTALVYVGHRVSRVSGAQEAISAADKVQPHLVIMEIQLANHNGVEFLYEFRSYPEWQNIPVVILSMIPPTEFKQATSLWKELCVYAYHYKPRTTLSQLIASVDGLVSVAA